MARLSLQLRVGKALASAGASEEILALVNSAFEACLVPRPNGRPRQYANRNEQQRAYRERKRREKTLTARDERKQSEKTLGEERERLADNEREERRAVREACEGRVASLKGLLVDAAGWNVDREADVAPIRALIEQGCDLEADVLPVIALEVAAGCHGRSRTGARNGWRKKY
jgi:hypothetical protein